MSATPRREDSKALRVGLVGPRRLRQGLGPYLATFFERAGAHVTAVGGRRREALAETTADLGARLGHPVRGYLGAAALVAGEAARGTPPDILVIASPIEAHEEALEAALAGGCHAFCDKPTIWDGPGSAARAAALFARFRARGLHVGVNVQWPETLRSFHALWPDVDVAAASLFRMTMGPSSIGWPMILDTLHHPISLLQAARPDPMGGRLAKPSIESWPKEESDGATMRLGFHWHAAGRPTRVELTFVRSAAPPRRAGYGFDHAWVEREIRDPGYRFFFRRPDGREAAVPDPTPARVERFLRDLGRRRPVSETADEVSRLAALEAFAAIAPPDSAVSSPPAP